MVSDGVLGRGYYIRWVQEFKINVKEVLRRRRRRKRKKAVGWMFKLPRRYYFEWQRGTAPTQVTRPDD